MGVTYLVVALGRRSLVAEVGDGCVHAWHFLDLGKLCVGFRRRFSESLGEFGIGGFGICGRVESGDFGTDSFDGAGVGSLNGDELPDALGLRTRLKGGVLGREIFLGNLPELRPVGGRGKVAATGGAGSSTAPTARRYEAARALPPQPTRHAQPGTIRPIRQGSFRNTGPGERPTAWRDRLPRDCPPFLIARAGRSRAMRVRPEA